MSSLQLKKKLVTAMIVTPLIEALGKFKARQMLLQSLPSNFNMKMPKNTGNLIILAIIIK